MKAARPIPADFLQNADHTLRECAEIFGVSYSTIFKWKRELGVVSSHLTRKPTVVPSDFLERSKRSKPFDLATHYGVSTSTISKWRDISGLTSKHGDLQAYWEKHAAILADASSSMSFKAIGAKHNVTGMWVRQILIRAKHPRGIKAARKAALRKLSGTRGVG